MKFTRRDFVRLSGAAALAGFGFSGAALAGAGADAPAAQTADSFRGLIGSEFYVYNEKISGPATLVAVRDYPAATKTGECFSLFFETAIERPEQTIYRVYHPKLGNFELFMTEGRNEKRPLLIAAINRL